MTKPGSRKSTIVRTVFGLLERRAPSLGSLWAQQLWCKIPRDGRPRPALTEPGAKVTLALGSETSTGSPTSVAEVWGSSGPLILLLHGWGGHRGQLGAFVAPLTAAGYRVIALDTPSHGDSGPGRFGRGRSLITDFTGTLAAATRAFGPAYGIVAHSLGGCATVVSVLDGHPVERLVLISPVQGPVEVARGFAAGLGFGDRILAGLERRLERLAGRPMSDFDAVSRTREAVEAATAAESASDAADEYPYPGTLPSLLVVHDRRDAVIPYSQGAALAAAWQGAELLATTGLGHHRILRDPDVVRSAVEFLGPAALSSPTHSTAVRAPTALSSTAISSAARSTSAAQTSGRPT